MSLAGKSYRFAEDGVRPLGNANATWTNENGLIICDGVKYNSITISNSGVNLKFDDFTVYGSPTSNRWRDQKYRYVHFINDPASGAADLETKVLANMVEMGDPYLIWECDLKELADSVRIAYEGSEDPPPEPFAFKDIFQYIQMLIPSD